jgi:uncharacterized membrane protein
MPELFPWFLFLHVMSAIIAFGPTFAFSIIGSMGGREPQHANFATRVSHRIGDTLVEPFAFSMPVTGVLMIWASDIPVFERGARWLLLAIVLYVIAISLSLFVSRPNVKRIIELTGGEAGASGPPPAGPPPAELLRSISTVQRVGMSLAALVVVIVFLMVVRPDFGF